MRVPENELGYGGRIAGLDEIPRNVRMIEEMLIALCFFQRGEGYIVFSRESELRTFLRMNDNVGVIDVPDRIDTGYTERVLAEIITERERDKGLVYAIYDPEGLFGSQLGEG